MKKTKEQKSFLKSIRKLRNDTISEIKRQTEAAAQLIETPRTTIMSEQIRRIKKRLSDLEKENDDLRKTLKDAVSILEDGDKKFQEVLYLLKKHNSY